jgi:hypothetical protein
MECLSNLFIFPHDEVRENVIQAAGHLFALEDLPAEVKESWRANLLPALLERIEEEQDNPSIAVTCIYVAADGIKVCGVPDANRLPSIRQLIAFLEWTRDSIFDWEEHGSISSALDHACELITALCSQDTEILRPLLESALPCLLELCSSPSSESRLCGIGALAEIMEFPGARKAMCEGTQVNDQKLNYPNLVPKLLRVASRGLKDKSWMVKRNSAFLTGMLFVSGHPAVVSTWARLFNGLQAIINTNPELDENVSASRDNAASALCKLITMVKLPEHAALYLGFHSSKAKSDLAKVVDSVLEACPLEEDMAEAEHVYPCLLRLEESDQKLMEARRPKLNALYAQVLEMEAVEEKVRNAIAEKFPSLVVPKKPNPNKIRKQVEFKAAISEIVDKLPRIVNEDETEDFDEEDEADDDERDEGDEGDEGEEDDAAVQWHSAKPNAGPRSRTFM